MKREDMTVGMIIEQRAGPDEGWRFGKILAIDETALSPVKLDEGDDMPVFRRYDQMRLCAESKEAKERHG